MNSMVLCVATRYWEGWLQCVRSWTMTASDKHYVRVIPNMNVMDALQSGYENSRQDILAYIHDDVEIYEKGWDSRVLDCFNDPTIGVVGFGGALGHGAPHLYTTAYHLPNLARQNFLSNMRSWQKHGGNFTGERDVAILDGFAIFVRRSILEKAGGWPVDKPYGYFMYSEWLCCEARRQGFRIRLVGVDCEHLGGRSSGHISPSENYQLAHSYFYEHNRDVMPFKVPE